MINDWQWIIWATLGDPSKAAEAGGRPASEMWQKSSTKLEPLSACEYTD